MSLSLLWEQSFQAFMVLVGISLLWLRFIESLFDNRSTSVILMIIASIALAGIKLYIGIRGIRKAMTAAEAQLEAIYAQAEEVG